MTNARYHRQTLLPQIGQAGQERLAASTALVIGCGALGATAAEHLVRSGVGRVRIADRDIVELTNLQRQVLFDEEDARQGLPKAIAAANRLAKINSSITIEPQVLDVDSLNIEPLCAGVGVIVDGTDNVGTRYLINDVSVKLLIPWVYGACVGTEGRVMPVVPGNGACLRCVFPTAPDARELATCDTAGVLGPVAGAVGAMQAAEAVKILTGVRRNEARLLSLDLWDDRAHVMKVPKDPNCPACGKHRLEFLETTQRDVTAKLCGRDAVQVRATVDGTIALPKLARRLESLGTVLATPYMVRCALPESGLSITVFQDGRVIVQGTTDPARAKSVVAKYVGS